MSKQSILVIEDEPDLREGLRHNLEVDGYSVDTAADGADGLKKAKEGAFALILLDLMIPELPGLEVLKQIREAGVKARVIIVSAKGQDADKVSGLDLGADDYVTKPFGLSELTARIRAQLRRTEETEDARDVYDFGTVKVDFRRFTAMRDDEEHQLSRYEAEILRLLIARRGQVVTRKDLLSQVWGYVHMPTTRTVDNHIARLRKKIERDVDSPEHVVTVHGIGYRWDSELQDE